MILKHKLKVISNVLQQHFPMPPWGAQPDAAKWSFLNGYRGFLAIYVALAHSGGDILAFPVKSVAVIAVSGFFVLSAFLLTYRLLKDLSKPTAGFNECACHLTKYTIRRFFRIYVVFIVFLLMNKYVPSFLDVWGSSFKIRDEPWLMLLTLQRTGSFLGHLWTVPVEIEYYFFIPVICAVCALIKRATGRLWIAFLLCIAFCLVNERLNIFNVTRGDIVCNENGESLRIKFAVFFYGSMAAILLTMLEANEAFVKRVRSSSLIQNLILLAKIVAIYICCRYLTNYMGCAMTNLHQCDTMPALIWGIVIVLMILGYPNFITNFFARNRFFTSYGQYSFGGYLWHYTVIARLYGTVFFGLTGMSGELVKALIVVLLSYLSGYLFFCFVENPLMKFANFLCVKVDRFFAVKKNTLFEIS
jgi:peptidoglycan/LPS O-acetylase OafA/YrhL